MERKMSKELYSMDTVFRQMQDLVTEYKKEYGFHPLFVRLPKDIVRVLVQSETLTYPNSSHIVPMLDALESLLKSTGMIYRGHTLGMLVLANPRLKNTMEVSNHIVSTPDQPELIKKWIILNDAEYAATEINKNFLTP